MISRKKFENVWWPVHHTRRDTSIQKKLGDIDWKFVFKNWCEFYQDDVSYYQLLDSEIYLWESYWKCCIVDIPDEITTAMKAISFPGFQNIQMALKILATMPVTFCSGERSFLAMRQLKNFTRSTMTNDRLNCMFIETLYQA